MFFNNPDDEDKMMMHKMRQLDRLNVPIKADARELAQIEGSISIKDVNGKASEFNTADTIKVVTKSDELANYANYQVNLPLVVPKVLPVTQQYKYFKAGPNEFRMNMVTQEVEQLTFILADVIPDILLIRDDGSEQLLLDYCKEMEVKVKIKTWVKCDDSN